MIVTEPHAVALESSSADPVEIRLTTPSTSVRTMFPAAVELTEDSAFMSLEAFRSISPSAVMSLLKMLPESLMEPAVTALSKTASSAVSLPLAKTSASAAEPVRWTSPPALTVPLKIVLVAVREPVMSMLDSMTASSRMSEETPSGALVNVPLNDGVSTIVRSAPGASVMLFVLEENPFRSIAAGLYSVSSSIAPVSSLPRKMMTSLSFSRDSKASLRLP